MNIADDKIVIRKVNKSDAEPLAAEYLNVIGGESDFLTFGTGQFGKSCNQIYFYGWCL